MGKTATFRGPYGPVEIDPSAMPVGSLTQLTRQTLITFANGAKQIVDEPLDEVRRKLDDARV